jgi:hypothetical protein
LYFVGKYWWVGSSGYIGGWDPADTLVGGIQRIHSWVETNGYIRGWDPSGESGSTASQSKRYIGQSKRYTAWMSNTIYTVYTWSRELISSTLATLGALLPAVHWLHLEPSYQHYTDYTWRPLTSGLCAYSLNGGPKVPAAGKYTPCQQHKSAQRVSKAERRN